MQAVICAAGRGNRLAHLTKEYPKALLPLGEKRVIEHILEALSSSGITDVVIVVGYKKEAISSYLGNTHAGCSIKYIENKNFDVSDNLYSMWLAREHVTGEMLFLNGDAVFHPDILKNFLASGLKDSVVVDAVNTEDHPVSVHIQDGSVMEIGHEIQKESHGDVFGIYRLSQSARELYFSIANEMFTMGPQRGGFFMPLQKIAHEVNIEPFFSNDSRWVNINHEKDYKNALRVFAGKKRIIQNFNVIANSPERKVVLTFAEDGIRGVLPREVLRGALTMKEEVLHTPSKQYSLKNGRVFIV